MTTHRARSHHNTPARQVPAQFAHLHPDWLTPAGWDNLTSALPAAPSARPIAPIAAVSPTRSPAGLQPAHPPAAPSPAGAALPRACDARDGSPTTLPAGAELPVVCNSTADSLATPLPPTSSLAAYLAERRRHEEARAIATDTSLTDPALTDDDTISEAREFHTFSARSSYGRETKLGYLDLPLRHRIYALHCQGRTISAIARYLRLDRGTVSRHLHAIEDLLLAEQTEDLARLRLRAIEAQHAILAACWDALLCEELLESDEDNDHRYPPHRAQLLATAARAARTAAQLQGLFTPTALQAAVAAHGPAPAPLAAHAVGAHGPAPTVPPTTSTPLAGFPFAFNATADSPTIPPALPDASASVEPAASCGMPASLPTTPAFTPNDCTPAMNGRDPATPPRAGEGSGERSAASPPRAGEGPGERTEPGQRPHTGAWVVAASAASAASRARAM